MASKEQKHRFFVLLKSGRSRNRIITMTAPGMAAEDTAYRQVKPLERSVLAEGFEGILGACGSETA